MRAICTFGLSIFSVALLVLLLYLSYDLFGQTRPSSSANFITVTCTAPPLDAKDMPDDKSRWLIKAAAQSNCREKLLMAITRDLRLSIIQSNSEIPQKDIELKVNVALQLSEIVDGRFLADGSYEMIMRAPRPVA